MFNMPSTKHVKLNNFQLFKVRDNHFMPITKTLFNFLLIGKLPYTIGILSKNVTIFFF